MNESTLTFGNVEISRPRTTLIALMLCLSMLTGCWFQAAWLQTALNDLPVLISMAQAILQIVALTGGTATPQEVASINQIGQVATAGLTAINNLYKSYSSANAATTITEIRAAGAALTANLSSLLAAAQIKDAALLAKVTAAVNLIVATVNTVISLLPASTSSADMKAAKARAKTASVPKPADLKAQWQQQVGFAL